MAVDFNYRVELHNTNGESVYAAYQIEANGLNVLADYILRAFGGRFDSCVIYGLGGMRYEGRIDTEKWRLFVKVYIDGNDLPVIDGIAIVPWEA